MHKSIITLTIDSNESPVEGNFHWDECPKNKAKTHPHIHSYVCPDPYFRTGAQRRIPTGTFAQRTRICLIAPGIIILESC